MPCMCSRMSPHVPTQWLVVQGWAHCPSDFTLSPRLGLLQLQKRKKVIHGGPGLEIISNSLSPGTRDLCLLVTLCDVSPPWPWGQEGVLGHCCGGHCRHINWHQLCALLLKSPHTHCSALRIHCIILLMSSLHNWSGILYPSKFVPASAGCIFPSYSSVLVVGLDTAVPVSCPPFLISCTWGSTILVLYGKSSQRPVISVPLSGSWWQFPRWPYWPTPWRAGIFF